MALQPGQKIVHPLTAASEEEVLHFIKDNAMLENLYAILQRKLKTEQERLGFATGGPGKHQMQKRVNNAQNNIKMFSEAIPAIGDTLKLISSECSEALQTYRSLNQMLYRGMKTESNVAWFEGMPRENRKATDTSKASHALLNKMFEIAGIKARRDNSIFVSSDLDQASEYGDIYIIFPKDGFDFSWSPKYKDFFRDFMLPIDNKMPQLLSALRDYAEIPVPLKSGPGGHAGYGNEDTSEFDPRTEKAIADIASHAHDIMVGTDYVAKQLKPIAKKVLAGFELVGYFKNVFAGEPIDLKAAQKVYKLMDALEQLKGQARRAFYRDDEYPWMIQEFIKLAIHKSNSELQKNPKANLKHIEAETVKNFIRKENGIIDDNFAAAVRSKKEICIHGEYHALNYTAFGALIKVMLEMDK